MGGARWWHSGLPSVALAEVEARRRELDEGGEGEAEAAAAARARRRRAAFAAASEAVERVATLVPDGLYKELYEALQRIYACEHERA